MLAYVVLFAVAINLCASIFVKNTRLSALGIEGLERINGVADVQHIFAAAVREAYDVVPELGAHRTGPDRLVLRMPPRDGNPCYVVFGALRDEQHLSRLEIVERNGALEAEKYSTYPVALSSMRFRYETSPPQDARTVTLSVVVYREEGRRQGHDTMHRFAATLRGENRDCPLRSEERAETGLSLFSGEES